MPFYTTSKPGKPTINQASLKKKALIILIAYTCLAELDELSMRHIRQDYPSEVSDHNHHHHHRLILEPPDWPEQCAKTKYLGSGKVEVQLSDRECAASRSKVRRQNNGNHLEVEQYQPQLEPDSQQRQWQATNELKFNAAPGLSSMQLCSKGAKQKQPRSINDCSNDDDNNNHHHHCGSELTVMHSNESQGNCFAGCNSRASQTAAKFELQSSATKLVSWLGVYLFTSLKNMRPPRGRRQFITSAQAIRLARLEAPESVQAGQQVKLRCLVEASRGDRLQSLAWYKNGREFYRYQPFERRQPVLAFQVMGVNVDLSRSRNTTVFLVNTTMETSGRYRCEATGTSFQEANLEKHIDVTPASQSTAVSLIFPLHHHQLNLFNLMIVNACFCSSIFIRLLLLEQQSPQLREI